MEETVVILARELGQKEEYVENVVRLLDEGNTIPFIARYARNCTAPWTTPRCAAWRKGCNT